MGGATRNAQAATRDDEVRREGESNRGHLPGFGCAKGCFAGQVPAGATPAGRPAWALARGRDQLTAPAAAGGDGGCRARRTYAATTIAEVVESVGVSRATFYELFHDKEDCFVATMDDWVRMLAAAIQPVVYAERDGRG
jgi:hypothetical protein